MTQRGKRGAPVLLGEYLDERLYARAVDCARAPGAPARSWNARVKEAYLASENNFLYGGCVEIVNPRFAPSAFILAAARTSAPEPDDETLLLANLSLSEPDAEESPETTTATAAPRRVSARLLQKRELTQRAAFAPRDPNATVA